MYITHNRFSVNINIYLSVQFSIFIAFFPTHFTGWMSVSWFFNAAIASMKDGKNSEFWQLK